MTNPTKYFINSGIGTFVEWSSTDTPGSDVFGKEATVIGGSGVDWAYVQTGASIDFSDTGGGPDLLYLTGTFASYSQTGPDEFGVYTFSRTVAGHPEVIKFSSATDADAIYFADGHVVLKADDVQGSGSSLQDQDTGVFRQIVSTDLVAGGTPSYPFTTLPVVDSVAVKTFINDLGGITVPSLPVAGAASVVFGSSGIDVVYVRAGTSVDFSDAGGENDLLYLTGSFAEYTQVGPDEFGVYSFTRVVGAKTETVRFSSTTDSDVIYFADGHVVMKADDVQGSGTSLQDQDTGLFRQITLSDLQSPANPYLSDIATIAVISAPTHAGNTTYIAGDVIEIDVTMKSAITLTGTPVFTFKVGTTDVTAAFDSANSTATVLKFKHTVTAGEVDANGISYGANAVTGATAVLADGTTAAKLTNSAVADNASHKVDTVAPATPTLTLQTDSGTGASDGITNVAAVNVGGLEAGGTWQYQVDGGTWQTGSGSSFNLTAGAHTYTVKQVDAASHVSSVSSSISFNFDNVSATPTIGVPGPISTAGVVATVTAEAGAAVVVTITSTGSATTLTKTLTGTGASQNISLTAAELNSLVNGTIGINAVATDVAGNQSAQGSNTVDYPLTAPAVPTIVIDAVSALSADTGTAGDFITKTAAQTVNGTFTGVLGTDAIQVSLDGGASWVNATADAANHTFTVSVTLTASGTQILTRAISSEGGTVQGASHVYTLDTVLPSDPSVAVLNPSITAASAATGVATVTAELGSALLVTVSNGPNTITRTLTGTGAAQTLILSQSDLSTLGTGTLTISATVTDVAGNVSNVSTASATYALSPPAAPTAAVSAITAISSDSGTTGDFITNSAAQTMSGAYTGTLVGGEKIQVSANGGATWVDATADAANHTFTAAVTLVSGSGTQVITRTLNAGGDASLSGTSHVYTLDATGPSAPTVTVLSNNVTAATAATGVVTVDAEAGATVVVTFTQGANVVTQTITGTGAPQTVTLSAANLATLGSSATPLAISAVATDVAGNASGAGTASAIYDTTVVLTVPTAAVTTITAISADTGTAGDFITKTSSQTVSGSYSGTLAGSETIQVSSDGGVNWVDATANTGAHTFSAALSLDAAGSQIISRTINTGVNGGTLGGASHAYTLDATGPSAPTVTVLSNNVTAATAATGVVTVDAEAGATVVVTFTQGANVVTQTITGTGAPQTVTLSAANLATLGSSATPLAISAVATDVAGNASGAGTASAIYDTTVVLTVPTAAVTTITAISADTGTAGDFITKTSSQTVSGSYSGTLAGSETIQVSSDGGVNWVDATANTGAHTFSAALSLDAAGSQIISRTINTGVNGGTLGGASHAYTLDTTGPSAPSVTVLNPSLTAANAATGVVSINADVNTAVSVTFTNGLNTITRTLVGTGTAQTVILNTADLTALGNGTINVSAIATDVAGNASGAGTASASYPSTVVPAPVAVVTAITALSTDSGTAGDFTTNAALQTVSGNFTGAIGTDKIQISSDGGVNWVDATVNGQSFSAALSLSNAGTQIISRSINALGTASTTGASHAYVLDVAGPTAPTVTVLNPSLTAANAATGVVTLNAETGSAVHVTFVNGVNTVTKTLVGTGAAQILTLSAQELATLGNGTITVNATAADLAGNASSTSAANANYPAVAPTAPAAVVTAITALSADSGLTGDFLTKTTAQTVSGNFTGAIGTDKIQISTDGGVNWVDASVSGQTFSASLTLSSTGTQIISRTINVTADASTNGATHVYTLDTTGPSAPTLGVLNAALTDATAASGVATVNAEAGSSVSVTFTNGGNTVVKTLVGTGASQTLTLTAAELVTLGHTTTTPIVISVSATDVAGNTSGASTVSVTYPTVAPTLPLATVTAIAALSADTGVAADFITHTALQTVSGSFTGAIGTDKIQVSTDGGVNWVDASISSQTFSASVTLSGAGTQIISRTTNSAGTTSITGASHVYTLDAASPDAPVVTVLNASLTAATAATGVASVNAENGSQVTVTFTQGSSVVTKTFTGTGTAQTVALTATDLATLGSSATPISISATATDVAGNTGTAGVAQVTYNTITPPSLPTAAVTAVTAFSADTGNSNDYVTKTAAQTVSGTYSGTLAVGEKIQLSTDGGVNWVDATDNVGTQTFTVALTLDAAGSQIISRTLNAAGDASINGTTRAYTLDTAAPTAPTVTPQSAEQNAAMATSNAGAVTVDVESGTSMTITFTNGAHTLSKTLVGQGAPIKVQLTAAELTLLTDGTIAISATTTDIAGNTSAAGTSSFVLNTATAIALPTAVVSGVTAVSLDSGTAGDFMTNQTVQSANGAYTGTLSSTENIRVSADGGTTWVIASTDAVAHTWTASNLSLGNGAGQIITQTINASGNTLAGTAHSYTLDSTVGAPTFTLSTGSTFSGQSVINGTAEANATVVVTINSSFSYTTLANANGVWSINLATTQPTTGTASFVAGTASISAVQTDVAGNTGNATSANYTTSTATSYTVVGPTDIAGVQLVDGNNVVLGVDEAAGVARFAIMRSGDTSASGTVTYTTQNGTATVGADYDLTTGTVTFAAGETLKIVSVNITEDLLVEANETFSLNLSSATGGNITTAAASATILDNEQSIWSVTSIASADEGAGTITYTISRTGKTDAATIQFDTGGGTATSGADFTAISAQSLSFLAGETSRTVTVAVMDDNVVEPNETVVGSISNASTGFIATATSSTTLNDNEQSLWTVASSGNVDEAAGYLTFIVSRTGAAGAANIQFATSGGTATAGADYTSANQSLSFADGEMSKTVQVLVADDTVSEANETVVASISSATQGSITTGTATATINDNDQSIWTIATSNVDEGAGFITYTVSRSGASPASTIDFATGGGTANGGLAADAARDYTTLAQTLSFALGEMSKTVQVASFDDSVAEANETATASINNAQFGSVATGSATATIADNEQSVWSVSSSRVDEGAGFLTFTVTRSGATGVATIDFSTSGGTAEAGIDYTGVNTTLSFAAGEMSKTVKVNVVDDSMVETNESIIGNLGNVTGGGTIGLASSSAAINDNDQSLWSVTSAGNVSEAAGSISVVVSRTGASTAATLDLVTFGTATPGLSAGSDYQPFAQTLSFADGEMSKTIIVNLTNDSVGESNETVSIALSNISQGTLAATPAGFTIIDDDLMSWDVSTSNVSEGAGVVTYTVSRNGTSGAATIRLVTGGGTASENVDYTATNTVLSFAEGELTKTIQLAVVNDTTAEQNETVVATLTDASSGTLGTATATATILDDEQSMWSVARANAAAFSEGVGVASFAVTRTGALSAATIDVFTGSSAFDMAHTATLDQDYSSLFQTLSFAAGEASKTVQVALLDDNIAEVQEFFIVNIANASTGSIVTASANNSINDNDGVVWSITVDANTPETSGLAVFRVSREYGRIDVASTVDFDTSGNPWAAGGDSFTVAHQTVSFGVGEVVKYVSIPINNNSSTLATGNISIQGFLSNASTGQFHTNSATTTLYDATETIWAISGGITVSEEAGTMTFTVTRTGDTSGAASVEVSSIGGTALGGADASHGRYIKLDQVVNFAAGEASKTVQLHINDDAVIQGANQTVVVGLSNNSVGNAASVTTTATLVDNDVMLWSVSAPYGTAQEGVGGSMTFMVSRTGPLTAANIDFGLIASDSRGAQPDIDFTMPGSSTLSFAEGESQKVVRVAILNDSIAESIEHINAVIGNQTAGQLSSSFTNSWIISNDPTRTTFTATDGSGGFAYDSASSYSFIVTRGGDVSGTDTISYNVEGTGGETAGVDFVATSGSLVFAAGERTKVVSVPLIPDNVQDSGKGLVFTLQDASAGTIVTPTVSVVVTDNDWPYIPAPIGSSIVAVNDSNVYESAGTAAFVITRYDSSDATTSWFRNNPQGGSATEGSDYTPIFQTLNWEAGESTKTVLIYLIDDAIAEGTEIINVQTSWDPTWAGGGATLSANIHVLDDDTAASGTNTYSMANLSGPEGGGRAPVFITRAGDLTQASVNYFRINGAANLVAVAGADYVANSSQTLNWVAGETQKVVFVTFIDDSLAEGYETVSAQLATDAGFTQNLSSRTVAIFDDDTQVMAAGVADTLTWSVVSGTYLGGALLDTGDMNDSVSVGELSASLNDFKLGSGNDRLTQTANTYAPMLLRADGGSGVDTFALSFAGLYDYISYSNALSFNSNDSNVVGFEILDLATAVTSQSVKMSLANVLEMTRGNAVANTLRIMGSGADTFNIQADGKLWRTATVGSTVTDVDGTVYTVVNSGAGNSAAMEVAIGGNSYDVYRYMSDGQAITLLVDTRIQTAAMGMADEVSDGMLGAAESADGLTTTVALAGQSAVAGQNISVVLNATNGGVAQTLTHTLTAAEVLNGYASITATNAQLVAAGTGSKTLTASVNGGTAYAAAAFVYDTTAFSATAPTVTAGAEVWQDQLVGTGVGHVSGTWTPGSNAFGAYNLTVNVGGATYGVGSGVTVNGNNWTLAAAGMASLAAGSYNVTASVSDQTGVSMSDSSAGELTVKSGSRFTNMTAAAGLPVVTNGANYAATIADFNGDGVKDIFVPLAVIAVSATSTDTLYTGSISGGNVTYTATTGLLTETNIYASTNGAVTTQAPTRSTAVDYNNDGFLDLSVPNSNANFTLLQNNGTGSFTDVTVAAGITPSTYVPSQWQDMAWADYNGDGFADVYLSSYNNVSSLFANKGNGTFAATTVVGMTDTIKRHGDAIWADVTGDGRLDLLVAESMNTTGSELYVNNASGTGALSAGTTNFATITTGYTIQSLRLVDYNNDGFLDVYAQGTTVNSTYKMLQNDGTGNFTDVTNAAFLDAMTGTLVTGATWVDYDMDGYLDLIQGTNNGTVLNVMHNNGNGTFNKVSNSLLGITSASADTTWAVADIDNNGTQDLYMVGNTLDVLYKNNTAPTPFLDLKVLGSAGNTPLYGAKVQVFEHGSATVAFTQFLLGGSGQLNGLDDLHFYGLDSSKTYDVKVTYAIDQDATATVNLNAVTTTFDNAGAGYAASTTLTPITLTVANNATLASAGVTTYTGTSGADAFTANALGKEVFVGAAGTDTLTFGDGAGAGAVATWTSINSKDAAGATGESFFTTNGTGPGTSWSGIDALQYDSGADFMGDGVGLASIKLGAGNDALFYGSGAVGATGIVVDGEVGTDALRFDQLGVAITLTATGNLTGTMSGGLTGTFANFENFNGSALADTLDFSLYATIATINGGAGGDVLKGGTMADSFTAGAGNDTITGNAGNDTIIITAGGVDTIKYLALASGTANALWGNGTDTITGFVTNKDAVSDGTTEDKLDLSAIFSGQGITVTTANLATYLNTTAATNSVIQIDRDGAGTTYAMTNFITLNAVSLTNADLANMLTAGQLVL